MPNWQQFAADQLDRIANTAPLDNGALKGGIPHDGAVWADHADLTKDLGIWVFFSNPTEEAPPQEVIDRHKAALRLLFEKCGLTELSEASGEGGSWLIAVRTPQATKNGRMTSISNLAKQIGYGLANDPIFGAVARGYADDIGLLLDVLLQELGEHDPE